MSQPKSPKKKNSFNTYARYSGFVFQMIAIIVFGTFIGSKIDQRYPNDQNWYTLSFSLMSVIIS
ncbi:MAG: AtpZ/AtpI family protein, partial [Croceitalea sp.]|nr:AtpZ/AtpI family protein [Croceitalea sp.]